MPGGFPLGLEVCNGLTNSTMLDASTHGIQIACGANNAQGAWTQLVASTTADCDWIEVVLDAIPTAGATGVVVNIGVGAAGSEKVVASIPFPFVSNNDSVTHYMFPLSIPAATAVSAQSQCNRASTDAIDIGFIAFEGAFTHLEGAAGTDAVGVALSLGTVITPSATANTKGAYTQLTASTSRDYMGLIIAVNGTGAAAGALAYFIDIAIGAGGSEKIIVPDYFICTTNGVRNITPIVSSYYPIMIPSGTAISARCQCGTAASATIGVSIMAVYQ